MQLLEKIFRPKREFNGIVYDYYLTNKFVGIMGIIAIFSMPCTILLLGGIPGALNAGSLMLVYIAVAVIAGFVIRAISDRTGLLYTRLEIIETSLPDGRTLREWKLYDTKERLYFSESSVIPVKASEDKDAVQTSL